MDLKILCCKRKPEGSLILGEPQAFCIELQRGKKKAGKQHDITKKESDKTNKGLIAFVFSLHSGKYPHWDFFRHIPLPYPQG